LFCCMVICAPLTSAEEQKYEMKSPATTMKDILTENTGKTVILRLDTGENLIGTVSKVGEFVVHLSKIAGKEYYDAVIRLDKISAVLFKVRG